MLDWREKEKYRKEYYEKNKIEYFSEEWKEGGYYHIWSSDRNAIIDVTKAKFIELEKILKEIENVMEIFDSTVLEDCEDNFFQIREDIDSIKEIMNDSRDSKIPQD